MNRDPNGARGSLSISLVVLFVVLAAAVPASAEAPPCKGLNKDDPGCDDGNGGGADSGDFHVVIDWDEAVTDHVFTGATISCANSGEYCEVFSNEMFTLKIPESYWRQWTTSEAQECFGGSLVSGPAEVMGLAFKARDHHGSPDHWLVKVDYSASFIGITAFGTHHANFQGDCLGSCPDLPPAAGDTNAYDMGTLTRTQRASSTKKLKGTACTCAWEDCTFFPNEVTVTVRRLP